MKRILVVDDNPQNNSIYIDPLRQFYKVDVAMALSSAKRMMRNSNYDLIVIDVMMPTQNLSIDDELSTGFEFYKRIVNPLDPNQKVLFWSNLTNSSYEKFFINDKKTHIDFLEKDHHNERHLLDKIKQKLG